MKRKYLIILLIFVLLSVIIFLGYNIYNHINYVPSIYSSEESNTIGNEIKGTTLQTLNIMP